MVLNKESEFFNDLKASGLRKDNWDLLILFTQFCEETGYGANELCTEAYNPFSVKAGSSWKGEVYLLRNNPEVIDGVDKIVPDTFRKYPSFAPAITDYVDVIIRRFPHSYQKRDIYNEYFYNLINGGPYKYATDKFYVENCISIYLKLANQNNGEFKELLNG